MAQEDHMRATARDFGVLARCLHRNGPKPRLHRIGLRPARTPSSVAL